MEKMSGCANSKTWMWAPGGIEVRARSPLSMMSCGDSSHGAAGGKVWGWQFSQGHRWAGPDLQCLGYRGQISQGLRGNVGHRHQQRPGYDKIIHPDMELGYSLGQNITMLSQISKAPEAAWLSDVNMAWSGTVPFLLIFLPSHHSI